MKPYLDYKCNCFHWIGNIPQGWNFRKLRRITKEHRQGYYIEEDYIEEGVKLIRITDLHENGSVDYSQMPYVKITLDNERLFSLSTGDFLFPRTGSIGLLGYIETPERAVFASYLIRFRFNSNLLITRYLYYFFISDAFKSGVFSDLHGGVNQNIHAENIKNQYITFPQSFSEQNSIVRFLDHKTGQIDRFIANRQKQIELLREQLHFKINDAITKGINPKVRLKPTDIKYVPEIPEHWDVRKFKSLTSILTCGVAATPEYVDESEGVPFLSAQNCRPFRMDLSTYNYIKPSLHKQLTKYKKPQRGDVLVTRVGAGIGQACVIDTDLEFSVYVSLTHIRPNKQFLGEYIVYFFNTEYCYQLNHEGTVVAGGQGNLNVQNVERYRIPLPPVEEQIEIIAYLDNYRAEMDTLISKYQKQTELMQEYRTSLISQAVTGKIDVRDWQPRNGKLSTEQLPMAITSEN